MEILQAFYDLKDYTNDTIDAISGIPCNSMSAPTLAATLPGLFSIEYDTNGSPYLCISKIQGSDVVLSVNIGTGNAYTISPQPFKLVQVSGGTNVIGPHPIKSYPGK